MIGIWIVFSNPLQQGVLPALNLYVTSVTKFTGEIETILCAFGAKLAEAKVFGRNLASYSGLLARELLVYRLDLS